MSKVLIAINGWVKGATNGDHQAIRDTYAKEISAYPNLDLRFFIGNGTSFEGDEDKLLHSLNNKFACPGHQEKAMSTRKDGPFSYSPREDEIILPCPDGYFYVSMKTKENHRWALAQGYDYVFQACTDTFIDIPKLMRSGFEGKDYIGTRIGIQNEWYAAGGCGCWHSKRACQIIVGSQPDDWAEDRWTGVLLQKNGVKFHHDARYAGGGKFPHSNNDIITSHLCDTPRTYNNSEMHDAYRRSKEVSSTRPHSEHYGKAIGHQYAADGLTRQWVKRN